MDSGTQTDITRKALEYSTQLGCLNTEIFSETRPVGTRDLWAGRESRGVCREAIADD